MSELVEVYLCLFAVMTYKRLNNIEHDFLLDELDQLGYAMTEDEIIEVGALARNKLLELEELHSKSSA